MELRHPKRVNWDGPDASDFESKLICCKDLEDLDIQKWRSVSKGLLNGFMGPVSWAY